ncbi:unnamed protein product [Musa textilis]
MGSWNWIPLFWKGDKVSSSGFHSSSTAEEITEGIDASQLTTIVTGATSGIGKETARVLALRGATVVIACRSLESGGKVKESFLEQNADAKIHVMEMDLSSLDSVESFARSFNSSYEQLHILINNAGIMACPFQLSKDGIEMQFATNHLGHFLLTNLLMNKMIVTAEETGIQGRIVSVSSLGHSSKFDESWFNLEKINDQSNYGPFAAYSHSKLANIWHANELSRHLQEKGCNITANSLHPGAIHTNLCRYLNISSFILDAIAVATKPFLKSIPQGASTTCYLALHPDMKDVTGKYFGDCNETLPSAVARDKELSIKCWEFSQQLLNNLRGPIDPPPSSPFLFVSGLLPYLRYIPISSSSTRRLKRCRVRRLPMYATLNWSRRAVSSLGHFV